MPARKRMGARGGEVVSEIFHSDTTRILCLGNTHNMHVIILFFGYSLLSYASCYTSEEDFHSSWVRARERTLYPLLPSTHFICMWRYNDNWWQTMRNKVAKDILPTLCHIWEYDWNAFVVEVHYCCHNWKFINMLLLCGWCVCMCTVCMVFRHKVTKRRRKKKLYTTHTHRQYFFCVYGVCSLILFFLLLFSIFIRYFSKNASFLNFWVLNIDLHTMNN